MSSPVETAAAVALMRAGRRPSQVYAELIEHAGSALRVLEEELATNQAQGTLFERAVSDRFDLDAALDRAAAEITSWRNQGIHVLTVLDPLYPTNLQAVRDHPPLLFITGELVSDDARAIAVIGTRTPSDDGARLARSLTADLVGASYTVVSGLAAGIDTVVHNGALRSGGRTVAILGTGLQHCYPAQNICLARRIAEKGALVSQFWPDAPPRRRSFHMRNGVMAGMTLGTVIVEATHTSGTRVQARLALAQGRPVFMHGALLSQDWAQELSDRQGAYPFSNAGDVFTVLDGLQAQRHGKGLRAQ